MKSLISFIQESLQITEALKDVFAHTKEANEILHNIKIFADKMKGKKISLDNQNERGQVFKKFIEGSTWPKNMVYDIYKKYGLATEEGFRGFWLSNHDQLEKLDVNLSWIKQFDLSEIEKQYKKYKESDEYVEGIKGEDVNQDEIGERDLVIYDRWNPDTYEVFQFSGKRNKNNEKIVNMHRMTFHYDYDVKYYDCYPILSKNYFGHEEELKQRAESQLGYDDPNEFVTDIE